MIIPAAILLEDDLQSRPILIGLHTWIGSWGPFKQYISSFFVLVSFMYYGKSDTNLSN